MAKTYHVYILAGRSGVLYTGVTNNLERRVGEHRQGWKSGFSSKYNVKKLVYCQPFSDIRAAIAREKEIKGWLRKKRSL